MSPMIRWSLIKLTTTKYSTRPAGFVRIGNVHAHVHRPRSPHLVPNGFYVNSTNQFLLSHLKWLLQKDLLKQDVFLIGTPGPLRSTIIFQFLELCNREYEYLSITRDTTEADLKQRREIRSGTAFYTDLCAVRAALNGRVLVLDGVEKAERNVLPILNSLLESREMQLDDGRFLMPAEKYDTFVEELGEDVVKEKKLERVSEDFCIIALGLPVPPFKGYSLDPPFRSRFQCRHIAPFSFDHIYKDCSVCAPNVDPEKLKGLISLCLALNLSETQDLLFQRFPLDHLQKLSIIWNSEPSLPAEEIFEMGYPYRTIATNNMQLNAVKEFVAKFLVETKNVLYAFGSSSRSQVGAQPPFDTSVVTSVNKERSNIAIAFHKNYVTNSAHEILLERMLLSNKAGDFCLLGARGSGKTTLVEEFCRRLGIPKSTVTLYQDMNSRELLQERRILPNGDTVWRDSELISCAKEGRLCILDGIDRVHWSTLEVLAPLIHHRQIDLFDGTRLLSSQKFDSLMDETKCNQAELETKGVYRIHPSFRILAVGDCNNESKWLNEQINSLFLFHTLPPLSDETQCEIIASLMPQSDRSKISRLIQFVSSLRNSSDNDLRGVADSLSLRKLIHIVRKNVVDYGEDICSGLRRAALSKFLPLLTREAFEQKLANFFPTSEDSFENAGKTGEYASIFYTKTKDSTSVDKTLVPNVLFYDNEEHLSIMESMAWDMKLGSHILLIGNQGVGKNKVTDRFLHLNNLPRQYLQLHRDTTVQSLTVRSSVVGGKLVLEDSSLVKAAREGHVLVIDEADKAPLHVVAVLKTLLDVGVMRLADGRRIEPRSSLTSNKSIILHPDFKIIMLANRPGFPFLGNNLFSVLGDLFSVHIVDNPSRNSELQILKKYAPDVDDTILSKLCSAFADLRNLANDALLSYPYSIRELVNVTKHIQEFPNDGVYAALRNVFDFDSFSKETSETVGEIFRKHGIPFERMRSSPRVQIARAHQIPKLQLTGDWGTAGGSGSTPLQYERCYLSPTKSYKIGMTHSPLEHLDMRSALFSEQEYFSQIALDEGSYCSDITTEGSLIGIAAVNPPSLTLIEDMKSSNAVTVDLSSTFALARGRFHPRLKLKFLNSNEILLHEEVTNTLLKLNLEAQEITRLSFDGASLVSSVIDKFSPNPMYTGKRFWRMDRDPFILFERNGNCIKFFNAQDNAADVVTLPQDYFLESVLPVDSKTHLLSLNGSLRFALLRQQDGECMLHPVHSSNDSLVHVMNAKVSRTSSNAAYLMSSDNCYAAMSSGFPLSLGDGKLYASFREDSTYLAKAPSSKLIAESEALADRKLNSIVCENGLIANALPLWKTPSKLFEKASALAPSHVHGCMEVIDSANLKAFYLPVPTTPRSRAYHPELVNLMAPSGFYVAAHGKDSVLTCDIAGGIRKWQLGQSVLSSALKSWNKMFGDEEGTLRLEHDKDDFDLSKLGGPKIGKIDPRNTPHVGGNTWAGGTGGYDTAGLGGVGGPFRLDAGHDVHQLPQSAKDAVPEHVLRKAREIAKAEYKKRLKEIEMSEYDARAYQEIYSRIKKQVKLLRSVIDSLVAKERERHWERHQTTGDLDDAKLVEGVVGDRNIFRRRMDKKAEEGGVQKKPKRVRFCFDVSGSMYRFNGYDNRLQRSIESALLVMESLHGKENKITYDIVGHSGETANLTFVSAGKSPVNEKQRMDVAKKMIAHSQFCMSGDSTLETISRSTKTLAEEDADERFVVVLSDANLDRYGILPEELAQCMLSQKEVNTFVIFIGSLGRQAARLQAALPVGRTFVCEDTSQIPQIMQNIFSSVLSR